MTKEQTSAVVLVTVWVKVRCVDTGGGVLSVGGCEAEVAATVMV